MEQNQGKFHSLPQIPPFSHSIPKYSSHSLIATIREVRSDVVNDSMMLLMGEGQAIPKEIPPHFLDKHIPHIEGIGEPTTATFFTHSKIDPTNWFHPSLSLPSLFRHSQPIYRFLGGCWRNMME